MCEWEEGREGGMEGRREVGRRGGGVNPWGEGVVFSYVNQAPHFKRQAGGGSSPRAGQEEGRRKGRVARS